MIKDIFQHMPILGGIMAIMLLLIAGYFVDRVGSKSVSVSGIVVDKHYKAERNSNGVGYGTSSSGNTGMVVTSSRESEKFLIMVRSNEGHIVTTESTADIFYSKEIGDDVVFEAYKGWITGIVYTNRMVK